MKQTFQISPFTHFSLCEKYYFCSRNPTNVSMLVSPLEKMFQFEFSSRCCEELSQKKWTTEEAKCRFIKQWNSLSSCLVISNKRLTVNTGVEYIWILLFGALITELLH